MSRPHVLRSFKLVEIEIVILFDLHTYFILNTVYSVEPQGEESVQLIYCRVVTSIVTNSGKLN